MPPVVARPILSPAPHTTNAMNHLDPSALAPRWLGKAWEHASEAERAVLSQLLRRERTVRPPSAIDDDRTFGERVADGVARLGGSWTFIGFFIVFLGAWVTTNVWLLRAHPFDPYPFIFLNLLLSMLAALQAPVIMMSQNRQEARDRQHAEGDYKVNLKAELEIRHLHEKMDYLLHQHATKLMEVQQIQLDLLRELAHGRGKPQV